MIRFDGKSEVEEGDWLYEIVPFNNCVDFLQGTIFQGNRLLDSIKSRRDSFFNLTKLEEEFFVFALDRTIFYMKMIKNIPEIVNILKKIDNTIGLEAIKDIRDMRTHVDEYKKGKGRVKERFFATPENTPPLLKNKPSIDATSSIMINDWYLIGGRVDFYKTMEVLQEILPFVEKVCQAEKMKLL